MQVKRFAPEQLQPISPPSTEKLDAFEAEVGVSLTAFYHALIGEATRGLAFDANYELLDFESMGELWDAL